MAVRPLKRSDLAGEQFPSAILDSLSEAVVVVDSDAMIHYANLSAEQFFGVGRARLVGHPLSEFVPEDSPLFSLLEQVLASGGAVAENGVTLSSPRIGNRFCALRGRAAEGCSQMCPSSSKPATAAARLTAGGTTPLVMARRRVSRSGK